MQKLIFVLIIAGAYAAPSLRGGEEIDWFTCPAEVESGCSGATQCLYPNPRDCHSYIQCNEVGTSWVRPCASSNLVWNNTKKECDWPTNSQCIVELATSETTTAEPITKPSTAAPSSCVDQQVDWFTCPDEVANGCTGPKDCLYPNPRDCHTFIQCNEIKTAWVKCCAPSDPPLVWNDTKKECDWPSSSQCIVGPTTPEPTTAKPTTEPSTAAPTTAAPTTAAPTTAEPSTAAPTTGPTEGPTTTEQNEIPTETPTEGPASSTTSAPVSTTPNSCGDDDSADADLDLAKLCAGCSEKRLVANPNSQKRYIECNGGADGKTNSVQRCSEGLLFSADRLTCDYAGLVNDKGPSK